MKKFIVLLAGLGVAATALPAAAAPAGNRYAPAYASSARVAALQHEINNNISSGIATGALTRREAELFKVKFDRIANLAADYRRSGRGLDTAETSELIARLNAFQANLRLAKNNAQVRGRA